ncbi:MAG: hypothetical protein AAGA48_20855 [Myxococcota bacterium]
MLWLALPQALAQPTVPPSPPDRPVEVFAELDGIWSGQFVGYDAQGKELYRIDVRQEYTTVDAHTQKVEIRDAMQDGMVITGRGVNVAKLVDGRLSLSCVVDKSNGDHVEHQGRIVTLPSGEPGLVWSSVRKGRSETFLEYVTEENGKAVYRIQGTGRYGDTLIVMSGRYVKGGT